MKVPLLPLEERKLTFKEVELGFTQEQALAEASRCLQCQDPKCVEGCPAGVSIPDFIKAYREGKIEEAAEIIRHSNFFPSICGRICQHERQCEAACILVKTGDSVCIGGLERFVGDNSPFPRQHAQSTGKKAAVIGSGPSGLTVAAMLTMAGFNVKVFESTNSFGGVIKYGVPEFRLPKETVTRELTGLHDLGIDFEPNAKIDADSLESMSNDFDVVFLGTGVGKTRDLTVPGSDLKNISSAMKFLVNLNQSGLPMITPGDKVVVVGAGYVGIDAARSAVRLGADVACITAAKREDAFKTVAEKDYTEAEEEGVKFMFGLKVDKFEGTEKVEKVHYSNGEQGSLPADKVIYAIGQEHDNDTLKSFITMGPNGEIMVNKKNQTVLKNVFAAGDCVHGPKTVVQAIAAGRDSAKAMLAYIEKQRQQQEIETQEKLKQEALAKSKGDEAPAPKPANGNGNGGQAKAKWPHRNLDNADI